MFCFTGKTVLLPFPWYPLRRLQSDYRTTLTNFRTANTNTIFGLQMSCYFFLPFLNTGNPCKKKEKDYEALQTLSCLLSSDSLLDNLVLSLTEPSLNISPNPTPRIFFGCAGPDPGSLSFPGEATGEVGPLKTGSERKKQGRKK